MLIGDARRIGVVARPARRRSPTLEHVFVIDGPRRRRPVRPFADLLADAGDPGDAGRRRSTRTTCSRSSTRRARPGKPKGATLTHRQAIANLSEHHRARRRRRRCAARRRPRPTAGLQSASLLVVPLFHVTGCLSTMTLSYATGAQGRADAARPLRSRRRDADHRARAGHVDRRRAHGHVAHPRVAEPRRSTTSSSVQARVVRRRARRARARRAHRARCSRTCARRSRPRTASPRPRRSRPRTAATTTSRIPVRSGAPRRRSSCASSTTTGSDAPAGERGEIWIKGPTVMTHGYWRRPDANEAAFTDGWFHTGDIGYLDADGFLYLVDRAKDMIIRAGENVYCVEIENVLFDHPDVIDAAVVGVAAQDARRRGQGGRAAAAGLDRDRRRHPRVLPRAPRQLQGAGVRRDPRRAAAAQPGRARC